MKEVLLALIKNPHALCYLAILLAIVGSLGGFPHMASWFSAVPGAVLPASAAPSVP